VILTPDLSLNLLPPPPHATEDDVDRDRVYASAQLQRGPTLVYRGVDLAEEGVGFGVPVVKLGRRTVFAGEADLIDIGTDRSEPGGPVVEFAYRLDREEGTLLFTNGRRHREAPPGLAGARDRLALAHREHPGMRPLIDGFNAALRRIFNARTRYRRIQPVGVIRVRYSFTDSGRSMQVSAALDRLHDPEVTEIVLMNELGAHHFTHYDDSDGTTLVGPAIGSWNEITAQEATLFDPVRGLSFAVARTPGACLFRGRELAPGRLAWAGFAHVIPSGVQTFTYRVAFGSTRDE
jgi:hypothetical protein